MYDDDFNMSLDFGTTPNGQTLFGQALSAFQASAEDPPADEFFDAATLARLASIRREENKTITSTEMTALGFAPPGPNELRPFLINQLLVEIRTGKSAKDRLSAVKMLGDVRGVDLFNQGLEGTVKQSDDELRELLKLSLGTLLKAKLADNAKEVQGRIIEATGTEDAA